MRHSISCSSITFAKMVAACAAGKPPLPDTLRLSIREAADKGTCMSKLSVSQAWDEARAVLSHDGKLIAPVALAALVLSGVLVNLFLPTSANGEMPPPGPWIAVV